VKNNVYLFKSGTLKQKDKTLLYVVNGESNYQPIEALDHIHVFGEVRFNKRVLEFLNKNKVSITFYTRYGNIIGRFIPNCNRSGKELVKQVQTYLDLEKRNLIIQRLETASARNCINVLRYYRKKGYDLDAIIDEIISKGKALSLYSLKDPDFLTKILLAEARIKQSYYRYFDILLDKTGFEFKERMNHPPGNEFNALLSFGYSLLYGDILNAIERTCLVAEISFVHGHSKRGQGSLQYDIADLFKPQIIDRLALRLIRSKTITKDYFYKTNNSGYFLNEDGRKLYINEYNKILKQTIKDYRNNKTYSYKQYLIRECYGLANYISKEEDYLPIVFKD